MKKLLKWAGVGFLILIGLGVLASVGKNSTQKVGTTASGQNQETSATNQEQQQMPTTYQIGDIVQSGSNIFMVNAVRKDPGVEFMKPKEGFTYLIVDATIENKSNEKINASTLLQMYVKDEQGTKYTPTIGAKTTGSLDGEILAGDKTKGEVVFEVPATATGLKFYFNPNWLTGQSIVVDLGA